MIDDPKPIVPSSNCGSLFICWVSAYGILVLLLMLTAPVTSHSDNWRGILPGVFIVFFGAYRLAIAGASQSTAFVFGCSTTLPFLFRFINMGRFSLWLTYQGPSTEVLVAMWIAICFCFGFLGALAAYTAKGLCAHV